MKACGDYLLLITESAKYGVFQTISSKIYMRTIPLNQPDEASFVYTVPLSNFDNDISTFYYGVFEKNGGFLIYLMGGAYGLYETRANADLQPEILVFYAMDRSPGAMNLIEDYFAIGNGPILLYPAASFGISSIVRNCSDYGDREFRFSGKFAHE